MSGQPDTDVERSAIAFLGFLRLDDGEQQQVAAPPPRAIVHRLHGDVVRMTGCSRPGCLEARLTGEQFLEPTLHNSWVQYGRGYLARGGDGSSTGKPGRNLNPVHAVPTAARSQVLGEWSQHV